MKLEYFESQHGLQISMVPETPKEVAELARISLNAKAVKPEIYLNFSNETPSCNIWIKKLSPEKQTNSIRPGGNK